MKKVFLILFLLIGMLRAGDVVEDICYEEPVEDGLCFDNGFFNFGFKCTETITIRNRSQNTLTNMHVYINLNGFQGSAIDDCGIDGTSQYGKSCKSVSNFQFDAINILQEAYEFDMPDYNSKDAHSLYTYSTVEGGILSGSEIYATYRKNGVEYSGKVAKCEPAEEEENLYIEPVCGVFLNVLQTRHDPSDIDPTGKSHIYNAPSCKLHTDDIKDQDSNNYILCDNQYAQAVGHLTTKLNVDYSFTLKQSGLDSDFLKDVVPKTGDDKKISYNNQIIRDDHYNKVTESGNYSFKWSPNEGDNSVSIYKLDALKGSKFTISNIESKHLFFNELDVDSGITSQIVFDDNPLSINIYKFSVAKNTTFSSEFKSIESVNFNQFLLESGTNANVSFNTKFLNIYEFTGEGTLQANINTSQRTDITQLILKSGSTAHFIIRTPLLVMGKIDMDDSSGNTIEIYADEIDIDEIDFGKGNKVIIHPYTEGKKVKFFSRQLNFYTDSQMIMDSGDYKILDFDLNKGDSYGVIMKAEDDKQVINLYFDLENGNHDFEITSIAGINSADANGDFGDNPPANFRIFVNGDFVTCNADSEGKPTVNALVYVEGETELGKKFRLRGAINSENTIEVNKFSRFYWDDSIDQSGWGECEGVQPYCKRHNLSKGFHVINPFDEIERSFEIYCTEDGRSFINLPIKNDFNNFVYNSDQLDSTDYYKEALDNSTQFQGVEVDINESAKTITVVDEGYDNPFKVQDGDDSYYIMGKYFSNINLIGTPFSIDFAHTQISNCDVSKLRIGNFNQAVKINTLNYTNARCKIEHMELKLLDNYKYVEFPPPESESAQPDSEKEVLERSCKLLAEAVPDTYIKDEDFNGYFWITPSGHNRDTSFTSKQRPFVVYCWYQEDLDWVWTFFLALDGKRTISKEDLENKQDTCSELGLYPFVPNTEETFERVRKYLQKIKPQWDNYTGTIEEKLNALYGKTYYLAKERDSIIWPYGSFGVYFPWDGNHDKNGNYKKWIGTNQNYPGWMSGSPMHNIPTITSDYAHMHDGENREYYDWSKDNYPNLSLDRLRYSTTDTTLGDGNYTYEDTMGAKGWRSILEDLGITDQWFISRTGAGLNFDQTTQGYTWPYYEPNGNYHAGCWLNYLFDSIGRVRHADDATYNGGCEYPYYDYMCMARDNYDIVKRYTLIKGLIDVIEHSVPPGQELSHQYIKTKIVNGPVDLDVILLSDDKTSLAVNKVISAGIFLDSVKEDANAVEQPYDILQIGDTADYNTRLGRFYLDKWQRYIPDAYKKVFIKFKYCSSSKMTWDDCWNTGLNGKCKEGMEYYCKEADSDFFAVRPKKFVPQNVDQQLTAGDEVNITVKAVDYNGNVVGSYDIIGDPVKVSTKDKNGCSNDNGLNNYLTTINFKYGIGKLKITYKDVGKIEVNLTEYKNSHEYASIDEQDTPDDELLIPGDKADVGTYHPAVFDISAKLENFNSGDFTYISDDLKMSAILELNITAYASDGTTVTKNYNSNCYAKDFSVKIIHNDVTSITGVTSDKIVYKDEKSSIPSEVSAGSDIVMNLGKNYFSVDHNGSAKFKINMNFKKNYSHPSNAFDFNINKIDVSDSDSVSGTKILSVNNKAHFLYGRVHVYNVSGYGRDLNESVTFEYWDPAKGWVKNIKHTTTSVNYGDINHTILSNISKDVVISQFTPVINGDENITFHTTHSLPYSVKIHLDVNSWLWYHPLAKAYLSPAVNNTDCLTHPCLKATFLSSSDGWGGVKTIKDEKYSESNRTVKTKSNEKNVSKEGVKKINW